MSAPGSDQVTSIDEQSSTRGRRIVQGESGGGSNDPPVAAIADERNVMLSVVIERPAGTQPAPQAQAQLCNEWLSSIMNEGGESGDSSNNTMRPPKHKLQEVPQTLRQVETNKKYYDPEVVSIGPYHHNNAKLKSFEKFKIHFTREYVKSCNLPNITALYDKVAEVAGEARNCYAEGSTKDFDGSTKDFDDTAFTQMMFLDGCFILQYILYSCTEGEAKQAKMKMKNQDKAFVRRDLFLFENQLPFIVLQALMSMNSNFDGDNGLKLISHFICNTGVLTQQRDSFIELGENCIRRCIAGFCCWENRIAQCRRRPTAAALFPNEPLHLLELKWKQLIDFNCQMRELERKQRIDKQTLTNLRVIRAAKLFEEAGKGIQQSNLRVIPAANLFEEAGKGIQQSKRFPLRSVMDLKRVGIHFRPNQTDYLHDITFKSTWWSYGAILTLPPINIDDITMSMLLNLVAYETCSDIYGDFFGVTDYICFLDSMIAYPDDVKELKYAGIISNFLKNDEEAVEVIHEIAAGLVPNDIDSSSYLEAKSKIEEYHSHRGKTRIASWIFEVMRVHFRSPWTTIAVIAGLFALFLTIIQTYFAVFPRTDKCQVSICQHSTNNMLKNNGG